MTGVQLSMGHMTSLLGEIDNLTLKDVWLLVPSNRATLNKIMKQSKFMVSPSHLELILGSAISSVVCPKAHGAFALSPSYPRPPKIAPHSVQGLPSLVSGLGKGLAFFFCLMITTLHNHVVLFVFTLITSSKNRCFYIHYLLTVSNYPTKQARRLLLIHPSSQGRQGRSDL